MERDYIILNIEGHIIQTKISTLTSVKNSYFSNILQGQWSKLLDKNGHLFIDRNSDVFMVILGYLRDGLDYPLPDEHYALQLIEHEARLFGLSELASAAERHRSGLKLEMFHKSKSPSTTTKRLYSPHHFPVFSQALGSPSIKPNVKVEPPKAAVTQDISIKKLPKKEKKSFIGKPKNFEHVVHIGWDSDGKRVVVDKSQNNEQSIKAIIAATEIQTTTPIYSMVTANNDQDTSESVEVIFAEQTLRPITDVSIDNSCTECGYDNALYALANGRKCDMYTKPVKKRVTVTDM